MSDKVILAKFRNAAGYRKVFPTAPHGSWKKDCQIVEALATELQTYGIPVKMVLIDGEDYANYLSFESESDSNEIRKEYAEKVLFFRKYTLSPAAIEARKKCSKRAGRPRKKQK